MSSMMVQAQNYVVGYLPTWGGFPNSINNVDLDVVTHIDIAFLNPNAAGIIAMPNGLATVVTADRTHYIKLYNALGQMVLEEERTSMNPIVTAGLPKGLYIIEIVQNQEKITRRLIIE